MTGRADASGEKTHEDRGNLGGTEYNELSAKFKDGQKVIVAIPGVRNMVNAEVDSSIPFLKGNKYRWYYTIKNHGNGSVYHKKQNHH